MMRSKLIPYIVIICIIFTLVFVLSGCTSYQEAQDVNIDYAGGYFVMIKKWEDSDHRYRIVYAKDSKVKYLVIRSANRYGITPLYNADGSLQIYDGDN